MRDLAERMEKVFEETLKVEGSFGKPTGTDYLGAATNKTPADVDTITSTDPKTMTLPYIPKVTS